jgi:type IX secretion system PorP/SprF family membrane protein
MRHNYFCFAILLECAGALHAQSYHFSQLYSTPLLNNPAFTGYTDGPVRIAANFRSQWLQGSSPYLTSTISADFSPLRDRLTEGSRLGLGAVFVNDQSSGGALQTNTVAFSMAYNLALDADKVHTIGVGLQASYSQRRIDMSKLSFESQFGSNGFDPNLPVGEDLNANLKNYIDANAGVKYNYIGEGRSFFLSLAAYNILQHKDNQLPEEFRMPLRYAALGGGQFDVGYAGVLYFSVNEMYQAGAHETTIGGAYGLQFGGDQAQELDLGLWYRNRDAIIPYIGYKIGTVQAGISYDYTVSQLRTASVTKNGFELSFIFSAKDNSALKKAIPWY